MQMSAYHIKAQLRAGPAPSAQVHQEPAREVVACTRPSLRTDSAGSLDRRHLVDVGTAFGLRTRCPCRCTGARKGAPSSPL